MTFSEINASLPNGLHDAKLHGFQMDYVRRQLTFDLVLWIGEIDRKGRREIYRPARLTFTDVGLLIIEPPSDQEALPLDGDVTIDAGEGLPERSSVTLPNVQRLGPLVWMYVFDWNSFILFSAGNAALAWTGGEEDWTSR